MKWEQQFKYTLRRHQLPTQVWYKAYPGLTAFDIARNARVREGLERKWMTDAEIPGLLQTSEGRMSFSNQQFSEADFKDIQGLVRLGHGHLEARAFTC